MIAELETEVKIAKKNKKLAWLISFYWRKYNYIPGGIGHQAPGLGPRFAGTLFGAWVVFCAQIRSN